VVIGIFNKKLVKHVFDDYLRNGEVDLHLSSMSPTKCLLLIDDFQQPPWLSSVVKATDMHQANLCSTKCIQP